MSPVAWTGNISIAWLLTLATVHGIISSVEIPARQSLVIELVGREDIPQAIALNSSGFNLARVIGPAVAEVGLDHEVGAARQQVGVRVLCQGVERLAEISGWCELHW